MRYKNFTAAVDWFVVCNDETPVDGTPKKFVWVLAGWGLTQDEQVVGMVSVNSNMGETNRLVSVPLLPGVYKHRMELSADELALVGA